MTKCPKCGEEIFALIVTIQEVNTYYFDGEEYITDETEVENETFEYKCPYCYTVLATTEEEARKILEDEEGDEEE
jgi:predicted RNA-binding Zn-ribbon protein involved in translation (DUF1610 family)